MTSKRRKNKAERIGASTAPSTAPLPQQSQPKPPSKLRRSNACHDIFGHESSYVNSSAGNYCAVCTPKPEEKQKAVLDEELSAAKAALEQSMQGLIIFSPMPGAEPVEPAQPSDIWPRMKP